ncbi:MAG: hypothetical protein K2M03_05865 [Muribaculaceae bacterium]|nr:hypothetical protein [Muribaculaceae bacterium]
MRRLLSILILIPGLLSALHIAAQEPLGDPFPGVPADSIPYMSDRQYDALFDSIPPVTGNQTLQIKVTPVDIDRDKPRQPVMHYYDKHGNQLETPVRFLTDLDTVTSVRPGPKYPLYNGTSVGINIFDPIMMITGQRRFSIDLHADVSLFNWIFPTVELGIARADAYPEDGRTHIIMKPTLYGKVGFNYNFVYKSNPDFQIFLGFRAGYSSFHFAATDLKSGSSYYDVYDGKPLDDVSCTSWYGQALIGIKVKIYRRFAMGWTIRYGFKFRVRTSIDNVEPWFIPGYGTGPLNATYSLIFNI